MVEPFDYIESQQDADELIQEFGQTGAIRRTVITPPPNDWTPGEEVTTYHAIKVAILPMDERRIDGTMILTGDRQALISPVGLSITPAVGDILMFGGSFSGAVYSGGEAWSVSKMDTLAPAGVIVLFDAVVRR